MVSVNNCAKNPPASQQELTLPNCRSRLIRAPRPNGFLMLARYAMVGNSDDRTATHFSCKHNQKGQVNLPQRQRQKWMW